MADQNDDAKRFTFEISLSVLNHLGRSLYRSFATVMGEAISNAWDADLGGQLKTGNLSTGQNRQLTGGGRDQ